MSDIRKGLKQRLEAIAGEKQIIQRRLTYLAETEANLRLLLEEEQRRWAGRRRAGVAR